MVTDCEEDKLVRVVWCSVELFLRNGYDRTTMRMIQSRTGLHSGSIYYMVEGKEGILRMEAEAFIGDIMCRSSRIARETGDPRMQILLPPAFLLYSASESARLSALLGHMFANGTVLKVFSSMAAEWGTRAIDMGREEMEDLFGFLYGGIGGMIRIGADYDDSMRMVLRFMGTLTDTEETGLSDMIREHVVLEGLEFHDTRIEDIDRIYGDGDDE
ncbi:MAG: TetR/AcrR family transcriptional regulator [Candidatus Methanomethylophilaceae archaeon]